MTIERIETIPDSPSLNGNTSFRLKMDYTAKSAFPGNGEYSIELIRDPDATAIWFLDDKNKKKLHLSPTPEEYTKNAKSYSVDLKFEVEKPLTKTERFTLKLICKDNFGDTDQRIKVVSYE